MRWERKVALEEHVVLPPLLPPGSAGPPIFDSGYARHIQQRLPDWIQRLEEMDRWGVQTMVLSTSMPGVQGICDRTEAVDTARRLNDELAEFVRHQPDRFAAF